MFDIYQFVDNGLLIEQTPSQYEYKGTIITWNLLDMIYNTNSAEGLKEAQILDLAKLVVDNHISLTPISANKLAKLEHKGKTEEFIKKYTTSGLTKCTKKAAKEVEDRLRELFSKEKRFRGRIPGILSQIAMACEYYNIPLTEAVDRFSINNIRSLINLGLPKVEIVLLYTHLTERQLNGILENAHLAQMISTLLDKSYRKKNLELKNAALWLADHANSDMEFLEKVYNKVDDLSLKKTTTIDGVYAQFSKAKALKEVSKIEKAYKKPGFKLKDCVCNLHRTESHTDRYTAKILKGDDPRQVMLGYETGCCQVLGDAGESAMMHGLLHPKAGFWMVTKTDSDKVVAQAEVWELNPNTLVFDNIEFANDAEIDQYKEIIGKWVEESEYPTVIMGCGYNEFYHDSFEHAGPMTPPVTPYELYVLSYEDDCDAREEICELPSEAEARRLMEDGTITYFDYVYCDSERSSVYLKRDNALARFFTDTSLSIHREVPNGPYRDEEYEDDYDDYDEEYYEEY